jgi:TolA-binding protein
MREAANALTDAGRTVEPVRASPRAKRRLWQLDPAAHDLLLALSFAPDELRRLVERAAGRIAGGVCRLQGGDADVLYATVRDCAARNPVSEALQTALELRHAPTTRRWRALRGDAALRETWTQTLAGAGETVPAPLGAALWALLTHADGGALAAQALCELKHHTLDRLRRAETGARQEQRAEAAQQILRRHADGLQQRLAALQAEHEALRARCSLLESQLRTVAERAERAHAALVARRTAEAGDHVAPAARQRVAEPASPPRRLVAMTTASTPSSASSPPRSATAPSAAPVAEGTQPAARRPIPLAGRRVLCVGGRTGARQRYRSLLEAAGAQFLHHDGGLEQGAARLDAQLAAADLVLCQSGCLNHEAYHRIKAHCRRTDTPCVYLARASLSHLARELGLDGGAPLAERIAA